MTESKMGIGFFQRGWFQPRVIRSLVKLVGNTTGEQTATGIDWVPPTSSPTSPTGKVHWCAPRPSRAVKSTGMKDSNDSGNDMDDEFQPIPKTPSIHGETLPSFLSHHGLY